MNRTIFLVIVALQIAFFFTWKHLGYNYGGAYVFLSGIVIIYFRRKYMNLKPYWGGELTDIPKYFIRK